MISLSAKINFNVISALISFLGHETRLLTECFQLFIHFPPYEAGFGLALFSLLRPFLFGVFSAVFGTLSKTVKIHRKGITLKTSRYTLANLIGWAPIL